MVTSVGFGNTTLPANDWRKQNLGGLQQRPAPAAKSIEELIEGPEKKNSLVKNVLIGIVATGATLAGLYAGAKYGLARFAQSADDITNAVKPNFMQTVGNAAKKVADKVDEVAKKAWNRVTGVFAKGEKKVDEPLPLNPDDFTSNPGAVGN